MKKKYFNFTQGFCEWREEALKAAEFFVKYLGILDKEQCDDSKKVVIVDDIAKVKGELNDRRCVSEE